MCELEKINLTNSVNRLTINRLLTISSKRNITMTAQCEAKGNCGTLPPGNSEAEQEMAALAKALAHPARIRILSILSALEKAGGCLNSDLVSELGLAQSTVSEHLRILKASGFITAESIPPKMCYRIDRDNIQRFESIFNNILK